MVQDETATYPNLGFNPVPGVPADVESMSAGLAQAVASMQESGSLLDQMRDADSGVWQGDAGDAFREHFNSKLVTDLQHAHTSLSNAVGVLKSWGGDLLGFKDTAAKLDQEAAEAKAAAQKAEAAVKQAEANPDLQLVGQYFDSPQALQAAQTRIDQAESALREAGSAAQNAGEQLDSIMKRAHELAAQHEAAARKHAQELEHATKGLAPHKPGFFSSMWNDFTKGLSAIGNWVEQHINVIHSVLSTISAVAGLVALCTPPPIDAIAGAVALGAGVGALACDLANPKVRDAVGGLLTGHFTMANLKNASTMGLDALSLIPGGKLAKAAFKPSDAVIHGAESIPTLASKIPGLARFGADTDTAFANVLKDGGSVYREGVSIAHSVSRPVEIGVGAANKIFKFADTTTVEGAKSLAQLSRNLELGWRAKSVASSLYKDVKQAVA
ncbi:hypothetical protein KGA66_07665 [Actinocrinis puniceicyclus]|uniref:WXG100 family type VII secretion target n=1 Tax=Actinocrinis puniceicyclus TaxID=977794 RepID=A0A8J7WL93_9ACTN|nr:hypothetical protein [Actinocrinis puniceicyclus]MBS2962915.1 hypothetical protein [Actinocrinis puniceicyclus]